MLESITNTAATLTGLDEGRQPLQCLQVAEPPGPEERREFRRAEIVTAVLLLGN